MPKIRVAKSGRTFVTDQGRSFVPLGVTYYRPGTGWAPQVWKQFDPEATRADFARMKKLGINCVRVFLSYGSFYREFGVLDPEGLTKFDQFLGIAESSGIYIHPTGPDHWEGSPNWSPVTVEDERTIQALEKFWELFAARYKGRRVIFAYDLKNEPEMGWNERMQPQWNDWLRSKYQTEDQVSSAWGATNGLHFGMIPIPPANESRNHRQLLDFQSFRESRADEWTRRQAAAIKAADPEALVTVGFIQWSIPALLPGSVRYYAGFRPERQAKYLDFLEVHFYPLERGAYDYQHEEDEWANLAYLESLVREVARPGKPVVLAEFGWYGGGKPKFDQDHHPAASQEQQARYCQRVVEASAGFAVGWLNWGLYDHPQASDCSEFTGLLDVNGNIKAWGKAFQELAGRFGGKEIPPPKISARPQLDWDACLTSMAAEKDFREAYLKAFQADSFFQQNISAHDLH